MTTERGFTLVELMVAVAIAMLFAVGIVTYSLARRPAALRTAVDRYDALMVQARSLAAASGNGATLVFLPRSNAAGTRIPGFTLRLYRGRPNATGALAPAVAAQVISDADIREARLGTPPFAVFLASDGSASALGAYPPSAGGFPTIANQPPCPGAQVTLEFRVPQAADTRLLSCSAPRAYGSARPYASPTPNLPLVDPPISYFHWPGAPRKQFVAVEFGYTRWFAAAGFTCTTQDGTPIATLPHNAPVSPYSPADSPQDAQAQPQPPADAPYAYASSTTSMQDAPATFYADPQGSNAGICYLPIQDAYAQVATEELVTMGALALSTPTIAFASPAAAAQTVDLEKTYDVVPIVATIAASTCAGIARVALGTGSAPATPSSVPATAPITVTAQSPGACSVTFGDQYSAQGEPPVTLAIAVRRAGSALAVVPNSLVYPAPGSALYYDSSGGFFSGAPTAQTQETKGHICVGNCNHTLAPPLPKSSTGSYPIPTQGQNALCPENVPVIPDASAPLGWPNANGQYIKQTGGGYECDYGGDYTGTAFTLSSSNPSGTYPNAVSVSSGSKSDTYTPHGYTCTSNNIAQPTLFYNNLATGPGPDFFGIMPVNSGNCTVNVTSSSGASSPAPVNVNIPGNCASADMFQSPVNGQQYCLWTEVTSASGCSGGGGSGCSTLSEAFSLPSDLPAPFITADGKTCTEVLYPYTDSAGTFQYTSVTPGIVYAMAGAIAWGNPPPGAVAPLQTVPNAPGFTANPPYWEFSGPPWIPGEVPFVYVPSRLYWGIHCKNWEPPPRVLP
ncbi:MAG: prepilin-type N-terminal cleavage/methylation domain-containing protein [Vulcanimicrobiaceae bacterium]